MRLATERWVRRLSHRQETGNEDIKDVRKRTERRKTRSEDRMKGREGLEAEGEIVKERKV